MTESLSPPRSTWRDRPWGRDIVQALVLGGGIVAIYAALRLAGQGMQARGIALDFGFLGRPAGFAIGEALIPYQPADSYGQAILVGLLNTIEVAILGCVLAVFSGFVLGAVRLSGAPLPSLLVRWYVEIARNTPLLLQLLFWSAVIHTLPPPRNALQPLPDVFLTNRGLLVPGFTASPARFGLAVLAGFAVSWLLLQALRWKLGHAARPGLAVTIALVPACLCGLLLGGAEWTPPRLRGFNFVGGAVLSPELVALVAALVFHSAAIVSEIVRGAVLGVPPGQWDATQALGLRRGQAMRLVILPQALRAMVPLLASACLSLTKSSSLAVAIGFPDLVGVLNTTGSQTGQQLETMALMAGTYIALNVAVSFGMGRYNARQQRWRL